MAIDTFNAFYNNLNQAIQENKLRAEQERLKPLRDLQLQNAITGQQDLARLFQQQAGLRSAVAQAGPPPVDTSGEQGELASMQQPEDRYGGYQDKAEMDFWKTNDPSKLQGVMGRISSKAQDIEKVSGHEEAARYVSLATGSDFDSVMKQFKPTRKYVTVGDKQSIIEYDPITGETRTIYKPDASEAPIAIYDKQSAENKVYLDAAAQERGLDSGRQLDPLQMREALLKKEESKAGAKRDETLEKIREAQLERMRLDLEQIKAGMGRGPLNPNDEKMAQLLAAKKITPFELSKRSKDYHAIIARASEINPNLNVAELVGDMNWFKSQAGQRSLRSIDAVENALPQLLQYSDAFKRTGVKTINKYWLKSQVELGNPIAIRYNTFIDEIATELGAVLAGGTPTVSSTEHAREILNRDLSPDGVRAQVEASLRATGIRKEAFTKGTPYEQPKTVRMRSPDGEERDVPIERVEYFRRKGASIVTKP